MNEKKNVHEADIILPIPYYLLAQPVLNTREKNQHTTLNHAVTRYVASTLDILAEHFGLTQEEREAYHTTLASDILALFQHIPRETCEQLEQLTQESLGKIIQAVHTLRVSALDEQMRIYTSILPEWKSYEVLSQQDNALAQLEQQYHALRKRLQDEEEVKSTLERILLQGGIPSEKIEDVRKDLLTELPEAWFIHTSSLLAAEQPYALRGLSA